MADSARFSRRTRTAGNTLITCGGPALFLSLLAIFLLGIAPSVVPVGPLVSEANVATRSPTESSFTGDVATVEGSTIAIEVGDQVTLNGTATVVTTDVEASNGVIHVIDQVILPAGVDPATLVE